MKKLSKNQIKNNTKKSIKDLLKMIEEKALNNIDRSLNCGALSDESEFLKNNHLLAMALIKDASSQYQIRSTEYKKEEKNLLKFI